jgi:tetratricopeptide (TPR) repeat protein
MDSDNSSAGLLGKTSRVRQPGIICLVLIMVTLAVYLPARQLQFLNYDDNVYVTANPHVASGLTGKNVVWAFTSVEASNWHPVTWISHMVDSQLYGMNPRGHHFTNVIIHALSAALLLLLLLRLTGSLWQSSFVAFLFALHPLHVESVAWVAERKDILSAFFWFLTLYLYARYVAQPKPARYLLALLSFLVGLMCKPMLVTLPVVLLLLDFWPLERYRHGERLAGPGHLGRVAELIKEKIPFFAFSLMSGVITIYAQHEGGSMSGLDVMSPQLRLGNALTAYVRYIVKTLWPSDLAVFYPCPMAIPLWQVVGAALALTLASAAVILAGRRRPYLAVGWFWFLITLVPVIGLLQVGAQSMADRYTYIPAIGLFIMVAWGVPDLIRGVRQAKAVLALLAAAILIASAALSFQQLDYWHDSSTLFRHALQVTTGNSVMHLNLGTTLAAEGDMDAAIGEFQEALAISNNYFDAHNNLGLAFSSRGELDAAIMEYRQALLLKPDYPGAHNNLGIAFARKGNLDAAILEFKEALQIKPDFKDAQTNLKFALAQRTKQGEPRK